MFKKLFVEKIRTALQKRIILLTRLPNDTIFGELYVDFYYLGDVEHLFQLQNPL